MLKLGWDFSPDLKNIFLVMGIFVFGCLAAGFIFAPMGLRRDGSEFSQRPLFLTMLAFDIPFLYIGICFKFNRTSLTASRDSLSVVIGPVPFKKPLHVDPREI